MRISSPPNITTIADDQGKPTMPWALFFDALYKGDTGSAWFPNVVNLTSVGSPTIAGTVYKLSRAILFFSLKITPATNTTSTAGTTYIDNLPASMNADGFCVSVSNLLGGTIGMCDKSSNRIYLPDWTTVTTPITIIGLVEAT